MGDYTIQSGHRRKPMPEKKKEKKVFMDREGSIPTLGWGLMCSMLHMPYVPRFIEKGKVLFAT